MLPVRARVPAPVLTRFPLPETAPESVRIVPLFVLTVVPAPQTMLLPRLAEVVDCKVAPPMVTVPVPRALPEPMATTPPVMDVPPE